ncbi:hypothetical protein L484_020906 [Morus notabilis]|uniref:Uncharacterized protein n=1 Tax=Morus notabilis TaxID=981085 RepID=W9QLF1_9ROSA|nr:hypothetical protein L484_020906 [Morus notabilis]
MTLHCPITVSTHVCVQSSHRGRDVGEISHQRSAILGSITVSSLVCVRSSHRGCGIGVISSIMWRRSHARDCHHGVATDLPQRGRFLVMWLQTIFKDFVI